MNTKPNNVYYCLLLATVLFVSSCSKDNDPAPSNDNQAKLMNQIAGSYDVKGMYDRDIIDNTGISITKKSATEMQIMGSDFPSFSIAKFSVSYKNPKDSSEYVIDAEPTSPNLGTITFTFPDKEILILTTIKVNGTTKRDLRLTGTKH